ncbi:MAG: SDR family NAD(P)-dependent oxidoreductase [Defluviitaleaceae bacterium]|nr:SDR family NAD(P)-dependent oxidoreductase [Defluviitaleaceae bacterium]
MKKIFVTGGSRGIGRAVAGHFLGLGWRVAVCSRAGGSGVSLDGVFEVFGDVADYGDCRRMMGEVLCEFSGLDVLVNNAGVAHLGYFADMKEDEWRRVIDVNLGGVVNFSHLAVNHMLAQGSGCIVNISSVWGAVGASCEAVYSASKGGVDALTRALAKEVSPAGIRVNALSLGVIDTGMNGFLDADERAQLEGQIPLGRFGSTSDLRLRGLWSFWLRMNI